MKILSSILLLVLSLSVFASNDELKQLLIERQKRAIDYKSIADSIIPGKLIKAYMVNDKLQKIASIDDSIIDLTNQLINSEKTLNDTLDKANIHIRKLSLNNDQLVVRAENDMKMLLILKIAAAVLIIIVLVFIYLYVNLRNKNMEEDTAEASKIDSLEKQNLDLQNEIDRLKIRDISHKQELERQEDTHNTQIALFREKYKLLEAENLSLTNLNNQRGQDSENNQSSINKLKAERDLLLRQHEDLKQQLSESKAKNETVMRKISKLISDLSSVNA